MNKTARLISYLLLNVLISACTTLFVLYAWDRLHTPQSGFVPQSGTRPTALAAEVGPESSPATPTEAGPTPTPVYTIYQVPSNQTLAEIAQQFNVSLDELLAVNGIPQDQVLGAGEALLIPPTPIPQAEASVQIIGVVGVGDLSSERVVIRQFGEGQVSFLNWVLRDGRGNEYVFPGLQLARDGSQVELYTRAGVDTASALYWNRDDAAWRTGDTVELRDAGGTLRASYTIP